MWEYVEFKVSYTRDFGRLLHHLDPYRLKHGKMVAMSLREVPNFFFGDEWFEVAVVKGSPTFLQEIRLFLLILPQNWMMLFSWVKDHLWRWFFLTWRHAVKNKGLQQQLIYIPLKLTWLAGNSAFLIGDASSRWWFPYLGKWSNLTSIFSDGWFNHQLVFKWFFFQPVMLENSGVHENLSLLWASPTFNRCFWFGGLKHQQSDLSPSKQHTQFFKEISTPKKRGEKRAGFLM